LPPDFSARSDLSRCDDQKMNGNSWRSGESLGKNFFFTGMSVSAK